MSEDNNNNNQRSSASAWAVASENLGCAIMVIAICATICFLAWLGAR